MPPWAALLIGFLAAVFSFLLGILLVGMGHGWSMPATLSMLLGFFVYPAALLPVARDRVTRVAGPVLAVLIALSCAYILFEFGMHSYWGVDTRGAWGSAEFPRAGVWAALLLGVAAMVALARPRSAIPWWTLILLPAAALSDEVLWYSMTRSVDVWNYRGDPLENFWLLIWSGWQVFGLVRIGGRLTDADDEL
jgi:hypothetical protein